MSDTLDQLGPDELEQLRAGLTAMALRALGDPDLAEGVAQETLSRTIEAVHAGRFREGQSLGAFAGGIARHVIADLLRTRSNRPTSELLPDTLEHHSADALANLISQEEQHRVKQVLASLPADDRQILELSFFEGLTPAEIAEQRGEPAERIRKRKSRALARLRQAFLSDLPGGHESP